MDVRASAAGQDPLLLRVARGEAAERTPVWLMRQAGRYMAAFREYSDKYPFRVRSETPEIAIELSLQARPRPWRAFQPDGVIFFSDILTPLPALGIEFDVIKGKGPAIMTPVRDMDAVRRLRTLDDPTASLAFTGETLSAIRREIDGQATLLGFVGTPWTLAAYAMEGKADRDCKATKTIMMHQPAVLHAFLEHLTQALITYVGYQIESGAQVVQLFDSWAHHLSPSQFTEFSLPYANRVAEAVRAKYPHVPIIFHANGGTGKLEEMRASNADVIGLDWATTMTAARAGLGPAHKLQGNVDPMVLFGPHDVIEAEVNKVLLEAGPRGHILNVGHGVVQGTPEESVGWFCELARRSGDLFKQPGAHQQQREAVNV
ncbi:MAG: uroporphyrinogen decarboxylase [Monoraphidium minutum]|nr:MAG: uroporphyrinogen decarboxylase [Monoraphidium minutum]